MQISNGKAEGVNIAYIGGGSRGWAWGLMSDLASEGRLSGKVRLYDIDAAAAKANEIIGNKYRELPETVGEWEYQAVGSLAEALTGADFVVISILPGTMAEMASDVHAPEKHGIWQPVGDTVGPGGLMRALRTIPMMLEIGHAIRDFAPDANVINYTNPMSLCIRALAEAFPGIKAFGCCHEVFGTQTLLADALADQTGIAGATREDIKVNVLGINHFTWLDRASYEGTDLFPVYESFVNQHYETGFNNHHGEEWLNKYFACLHRVKFDLFRRYGLIAAAGDRHLAEFMPPWYVKDPETVEAWGFGLTPVSWRVAHRESLLERSRKLVSGEETVKLNKTGEEGIRQICALLGLEDLVTNVNLPNRGQIANLPMGTVVETNALFRKGGVQPVMAGSVPEPVLALLSPHVVNQDLALRAAVTCDRKLALTAFLNDPLMTLEPVAAEHLFDEMLENTKKYLPGW